MFLSKSDNFNFFLNLKENNVKIENENQHQSLDSVVHQVLDNLDSYEPDGAVESLESAELDSRLVETKIEVDKFPQ